MNDINSEIQKAVPDAVVTMFDLDLRPLGGNVFNFTSAVVPDGAANQPVLWREIEYLPMPIEASGFEASSSGQFPRPKLTVSNVLGLLKAEMIKYNNLQGAIITRWRTFRKHLDDGTDPDPDVYFPPDVYKIDRKSSENQMMIEFELTTIIDQQGILLPRRQVLRNTCTHVYRVWVPAAGDVTGHFDYSNATCPYADTNYFDENGKTVTDPSLDNPSKQVSTCCKPRFPNQALPTRAFPGVGV